MKPTATFLLFRRVLLLLTILLFAAWAYFFGLDWHPLLSLSAGMGIGIIVFYTFKLLFKLLEGLIVNYPSIFNATLLAFMASVVFVKFLGLGLADQVYYAVTGGLLMLAIFFSASWSRSKKGSIGRYFAFGLPLLLIGVGAYWLWSEGSDPYAEEQKPMVSIAPANTLAAQGIPDPAGPGIFLVDTFTYGNGTDQKREEYAEGVRFTTPTVDASLLLPEWKGKKKKWRERYWGFGTDEFPLNGRVYLPQGEGPFPLVLIVHGNHSMIDYSDGGYSYLGQLLASRGMIVVSVDENFINGHWSGDFMGREMPTRAWLLLKHLEQWQKWNKDPKHELYGQVDMDNIMLVGHSRGGEAVAITAAFNNLPAYPDNALLPFDFNFNIKAVVAIAPTDYRYHRQIDLANVNYLSLQGSYDSDEVSFWGLRTYRRLQFTGEGNWMKAAVYIHRANHGQFNSSWGRSDFGGPMSWLLNTYPLLSGEDQRATAKVFVSAFAEATLKGNQDYLPLFIDVNRAGGWLPENYYLSHFAQNGDQFLQNFEEDINIYSARDSGSIQTENLVIFREENLLSRDEESQQNNALILGWDNTWGATDSSVASYELIWPDSTLKLKDSISHFLISLAPGDFGELESISSDEEEKRPEQALDVIIRLTDSTGASVELIVSEVKAIAPALRSRFLKVASISEDMIGDDWEVQLQHFALPITAFKALSGDFDIQSLQRIQLALDQTSYGVLVVDDIGLR